MYQRCLLKFTLCILLSIFSSNLDFISNKHNEMESKYQNWLNPNMKVITSGSYNQLNAQPSDQVSETLLKIPKIMWGFHIYSVIFPSLKFVIVPITIDTSLYLLIIIVNVSSMRLSFCLLAEWGTIGPLKNLVLMTTGDSVIVS